MLKINPGNPTDLLKLYTDLSYGNSVSKTMVIFRAGSRIVHRQSDTHRIVYLTEAQAKSNSNITVLARHNATAQLC